MQNLVWESSGLISFNRMFDRVEREITSIIAELITLSRFNWDFDNPPVLGTMSQSWHRIMLMTKVALPKCWDISNIHSDLICLEWPLRGYRTSYSKKDPKLACFVLYLKIINIFLKNNVCIL